MAKRKFLLKFSAQCAREPITYLVVKNFDIKPNILQAQINEKGGRLVVEMEGKPSQIQESIVFLEKSGVQVKELNEYVSKDNERCTHCGACVSICPTEAFEVDRETWKIIFHPEKCIACGLCIDACSPGAMKLELWE
jgi:ferredoxin